jgi:putative ABC transport system permease protein
MRKLLRRIRYWMNRRRLERELAEEIESHRSMKEEDFARSGLPPNEAAASSRHAMGNSLLAREDSRGAWIAPWLDQLFQDIGYGLRQLRRNPGFTCIAVLTLATGIGANAAIFTIVNGILLESLPYKDPRELVLMFEHLPNASAKFGFSPPDFEFIRREARSFSIMAAYRTGPYELSGIGESQRLIAARVSPEVFAVLGATPAAGRLLTADDDSQRARVVLLSDGLWSRAFGRDPSAVGRSLMLDGVPYIVVGVMPRTFEFPPRGGELNSDPAEAFLPMSFSPVERQGWGMRYNNTVVARLKPGVTVDQAREEIASLVKPLIGQYPPQISGFSSGMTIPMAPFNEEVVGRSRRLLLVLMSAVALVLLIGCADVASLILTRSSSRQREMAIRASLGGGPMRIFRQLLTEGLTLAAAGGAMALVFAYVSRQILMAWAGEWLPRATSVAFNFRVVGFTAVVSLLTPLLFAVMPAVRAVLSNTGGGLTQNVRTATTSRSRSRLLGMFVVAQVALALVLSVGAGLLVRSFLHLLSTDTGFRPERVVRLTATLPLGRYNNGQRVRAFYQQAIEAAERIPGVTRAAAGNDLPLAAAERRAFTADGNAKPIPIASRLIAPHWVSSNYFDTLGIALKRGRFFTEADNQTSQPVIVINESVARLVWPDADPIGQRIKWGLDASFAPWMTIVGVVGDVKHGTLDVPAMPQVYVPTLQNGDPDFNSGLQRTINLVVRTKRDGDSVIADLRTSIRQIDPQLPVIAQTLPDMIGDSLRPQRFSTGAVMLFASIALLLAAIGIYGVLSNVVSQQTTEIGVRIALGATTSDVLWLVFRRALIFTAIGVGIGTTGALAVTRLMSSLLYGIRATDGITFFAAALALALLAFAASLIPAWRATRIDPLEALAAD